MSDSAALVAAHVHYWSLWWVGGFLGGMAALVILLGLAEVKQTTALVALALFMALYFVAAEVWA